MRLFVMVGAPGAGKGTRAAILARARGVPHVASGELFRAAIRGETPLGRQVQEFMGRGALVPDELAIRLILHRLAEPDAAAGARLGPPPPPVSPPLPPLPRLAGRDAAAGAPLAASPRPGPPAAALDAALARR